MNLRLVLGFARSASLFSTEFSQRVGFLIFSIFFLGFRKKAPKPKIDAELTYQIPTIRNNALLRDHHYFCCLDALSKHQGDPFFQAATLIFGIKEARDDLISGKPFSGQKEDEFFCVDDYLTLFGNVVATGNKKGSTISTKDSNRIIVALRGGFFECDLSRLTSVEELSKELKSLELKMRSQPLESQPIGFMTCAYLSGFSLLWEELEKNNRSSLEKMESSLFHLVLDLDDHPSNTEETVYLSRGWNSPSRWYTSQLQVIVFGNGRSSFICSHRGTVGLLTSRFASEVYHKSNRIISQSGEPRSSNGSSPSITELPWIISDQDKTAFEKNVLATDDPRLHLDRTYANGWVTTKFGKKKLKEHGLIPHSTMSVVFQLASFLTLGRHVPFRQPVIRLDDQSSPLVAVFCTTKSCVRFSREMVRLEKEKHGSKKYLLRLFKRAVLEHDAAISEARKGKNYEKLLFEVLSQRPPPFALRLAAKILRAIPSVGELYEIMTTHDCVELATIRNFPGVKLIGRCLIVDRLLRIALVVHEDSVAIDFVARGEVYGGKAELLRSNIEKSVDMILDLLEGA